MINYFSKNFSLKTNTQGFGILINIHSLGLPSCCGLNFSPQQKAVSRSLRGGERKIRYRKPSGILESHSISNIIVHPSISQLQLFTAEFCNPWIFPLNSQCLVFPFSNLKIFFLSDSSSRFRNPLFFYLGSFFAIVVGLPSSFFFFFSLYTASRKKFIFEFGCIIRVLFNIREKPI